MPLRIKHLITSAVITTFVITLVVLAIYFFTGGTSFYEAGRFLLLTGITLTVIVIPLFYRSHHRARLHIHLHLPVEERNRIIADPYYDYFAGVAFGTMLTVALSFGMLTLASTLEGRRSLSANMPFVGSVKAELPNLYKIARQWQNDAYLVELSYNFGSQAIYPTYDDYIFSANFRSLSEPDTSLVIEVSRQGKYLKNYSFHLPPSSNWQIPISDENWTIDSQEAVSVFAQDSDIRACLKLDHPKKLQLTQEASPENGQVIWCLHDKDCYEIDDRICIDAVTGEPIPLEQ
jgi:hypothetical protein